MRPRWYHVTPDRFVVGVLAMVALVWLCERFDWFKLGHHNGWAVLIAVAASAAALSLLILWFAVALLFRRRFQFGIRSLLLLGLIVALLCSWMTVKIRAAKLQHDIFEAIVKTREQFNEGHLVYDNSYDPFANSGQPGEWRWLRELLTDDFFHDIIKIGLYSDVEMKYLDGLPQLQELHVGSQDVTDVGMENVKGLKELRSVEISVTSITDNGLLCLGSVPSLRKIRLFSNDKLTSAAGGNLRCLPQLIDVDMAHAPITDEGLEGLASLQDLRTLCLADCGITDDGLKRLQRLAHLESLDLNGTEVTDAGLKHLSAFTRLKSLDLHSTRLTDAGLTHLRLLPIERLDVSNTGVTDAGLAELKALSRLESLSLNSRLLTATGVRHLQALPRLTKLDLVHVGDEDLENMKNLSQLRTLNLWDPLTSDECMKRFQQALPNCKVDAVYFST